MPIPILMPALSPTMEEGTLAKWLVRQGDSVSSGDVIAEIETDKATMEVEAVDEGTVGKLLVAEGTEGVPVNAPIAVLLEEGEDESALSGFDPAGASAAPSQAAQTPAADKGAEAAREPVAAPQDVPQTQAAGQSAASGRSGGRILASPLALRMAAQAGLDIAQIPGSGPNGRVVKHDIEAAMAGGGAAAKSAPAEIIPMRQAGGQTTTPQPTPNVPAISNAPELMALGIEPGSFDEYPLNNMRKTIARRLTQAKQTIPHYYLTIDCQIDGLLALRKELNSRSPEGEDAYKISVNDFVIRASALALKKVPECNASWTDSALLLHHHADIGVAVAIDGGLITPIIRQAEHKGLAAIAMEARDMAEKARGRKLKPEEYTGGSFAISNLGMFGIKNFTAVINPPHAMILAVGAGEQRPVVRGGALTTATVMTVTLSCDHRVVDGALGARWLDAFKGFLEDPVTMML